MLIAVVKRINLNSGQKIFPTNNILTVKWQPALHDARFKKNSKLGIFLNKAKFLLYKRNVSKVYLK